MNFFHKIVAFFHGIPGKIISSVAGAQAVGLTDELVILAEQWVRIAAQKTLSSDQKRDFVVQILVARRVPEPIARLAVELAYAGIKAELDSLAPPPLKVA